MARRCNIPNAMSLTIHKIDMRLKVCISQCNYFKKHKKAYWQKHLLQCLDAAKEKEANEAAKQILAIIQREKDKSLWRQLKAQVNQGNENVQEYVEKEQLQEAIWNHITKSASTLQRRRICTRDRYKDTLGTTQSPGFLR
jgi:hypothetical protein